MTRGGEQMNFPDTFEEFAERYKIIDKEEVYTNSIELIPVFRVKQWLEHIKTGHWKQISPAKIYECSVCGQNIMTNNIVCYKYCHVCGAKMVEAQESEE